MKKIIELITDFKKKSVLVIGDIMLDQYTFGEISRISPEAPVPIVLKTKEDTFVLGGAANVASNIVSLGAKSWLVGIVGDDQRKEIIMKLLKEKGINSEGLITVKERPTTLKNRIVADNFHQVLRFDDEKVATLAGDEEKRIIDYVSKIISGVDVVILSDYAKGLFSTALTKKIIEIAKKNKKIIIADTKPANARYFKGVDLISPNLKEAAEMTGKEDFKDAGKILAREFNTNVFITLGSNGIAGFLKNEKSFHIPARKVKVFDVSGAGDTVVAVVALSLASNFSLEEAATLACKAGTIVVQKPGTATLTAEELESVSNNLVRNVEDVPVVPKLWGYEKWLENNDKYCCKLLALNKGYQCSLHYHNDKDEMFYISKGHVRLESDGKISHMREGDYQRIKPGTKHRFRGIEDSVIIEVSTHHEDSDSIRIEESKKVEDESKN